MKIVFMGTPEFAVHPLRHLLRNRHDILTILTQPDRISGRGQKVHLSPVKLAAQKANLPVLQPEKLKDTDIITRLRAMEPDCIVVAAYGQIVPREVLNIPRYGCVNIHPSLLPKYRGASPVPMAILAGDRFAGTTIMQMDAHLDTGPVLMQAQIPVSDIDTADTLLMKLSYISAALLQETLVRLENNDLVPRQQNNDDATWSATFTKADGEIDWNKPAVELWRRIRAFTPWPGCYTRYRGKKMTILEAVPLPAVLESAIPGEIVVPEKRGTAAFGVVTGEGILGVTKVQMEGKKAMAADEFVRGQRQLAGTVLLPG